jgi:uncharacterized membrane protein
MRLRLHAALVHFPVACWTLATAGDGVAALGVADAWRAGSLLMLLGVALAIPAVVAGAAELLRLPEPLVGPATVHMSLMAVAWCLYLAACVLRFPHRLLTSQPVTLSMALGVAGFAVMAVGAHLGGRLVYRVGASLADRE